MSEIKINQLKGFLKTAAESANLNNDKKLKGEEEISAFIKIADKLATAGLVDENYKEALGLNINQETTSKVVTQPDNNYSLEDNEAKLGSNKTNKKMSKFEKECQDAVMKNIKYNVDKNSVTLSNLYETLSKNFSTIDYEQSIKDVKAVIDYAMATGFDSKDDIKALKKAIKKEDKFNDFQKSLADEIADYAKKEQIAKETAKLIGYYENAKVEGDQQNFTAKLNAVKEQMKEGIKNKSYSDEAYNELEAYVKEKVETWAYSEMSAMQHDKVDYTKKHQILSAIKDKLPKSDKFAKNVVDKMDDFARAERNRLNYYRNLNTKLMSISKDDLRDELGKNTFHVINGNFLETALNEDGSYNLKALADIIKGATGADWEMNSYEDKKQSEMQEAIDNLKTLIKRGDLSESQVEKLKDLCEIKDAPKSRNVKEAFFGDAEKSATKGAVIGALLGTINLHQLQEVYTDLVTVIQEQSIKVPAFASIPAAVLAEFIMEGITNLAFGMEKGERTCFKYEKAEGKTINEYIEYVGRTENEDKAKGIAMLAKLYYDKFGENWNKEFMTDMKKIAGNDILNCKEFLIGRLEITKKLEGASAEKTEDKPEKKPDIHTYSTFDIEGSDPVYEDVEAIDAKHTTWSKVAGQYPCLVEKYGLSNAIRMVKIAQAIKGDYTEKRLVELLEQSKRGLNAMRNIEGFDFDIYKQFYTGTVLPNREKDENGEYIPGTGLKMPKKLAGCDRDASISLDVRANEVRRGGGRIIVPDGHVADKHKVKDGSDDYRFARFDNGVEQNYKTEEARQDAIKAFEEKHGKENVRRTPWE